jgi:ribosomal RNA-processing protein 1
MCDRPLPQQQLAQALADLVHVLPATSKSSKASGAHGQESKIQWLQAFWQTMGREWTGIDVLRMEKFLLLVRRVLCSGFEMCKRAEWDGEVVRAMLDVLSQGPLEPKDQRVPNGMRYHAIDIYVDELERVGVLGGEGDKEEGEEADKELVERLLEPLRVIAKESPTKTVRVKAKEALGDERLPGNKKTEEEIAAAAEEKRKREEEEGWGGIED